MKSVLIIAVLILIINAAGTRANHVVGDMVLSDKQYEDMTGDNDAGHVKTDLGRERRNALKSEDYRWPGGVIPFKFDSSFTRKEKRMVRKAMGIWSRYTCLSFRPYRSGDKNFVVFRDGKGCSSNVGMYIGQQPITLQKDGCRLISTVLHELGHAIGMFHTQNRPDRNEHLVLDLSDVDAADRHNFERRTWQEVHHYGVEYDFHSIMHYGSKDFGDESGKVIKTKNPEYQKIIGEAETLSFGDLEMVNKMYKCKPSSCNLKDSNCPGISYVGASCTCLCPGPNKDQLTQPCPATETATEKETTALPTTTPTDDEESTTDTYSTEDYSSGSEEYPVTPTSDDYPYGTPYNFY